uniref:Uncharacterized protein n=1 Tax=Anopheles atroparvus TaxID=41427 RepID=A0AAG5DUR2_ANOAO
MIFIAQGHRSRSRWDVSSNPASDRAPAGAASDTRPCAWRPSAASRPRSACPCSTRLPARRRVGAACGCS